jgi:GNAT superfamily N-acetyltransferase
MKNDFIFRKAEIKDLEGILELNFKLFKREYKNFDESLDLNWTYKNKSYFKNRIVENDGFVKIIENKNKIIGYLCGGVRPSEGLDYRKKANYAELENMLIEKRFRGKGLGTKLTKDFVSWCKKNKIDCLSVTASAKNKPTIDFYKKLGFKAYDLTLEMNINRAY